LRHLKELALPRNIEEFWEKKNLYGPKAVVIAGGTEMLSEPPEGVECLIDIRNLALDKIEAEGDSIVIGAAVTMEALTTSELAKALGCGMLSDATCQGWPVAVRSAATIGGNVAGGDPFADTPPVLLALGAHFHLETPDGPVTIPVEDFFLDYRKTAAEDSILMSISIPKGPEQGRGAFIKVAPVAVDKAMVNLGVYAVMVEGRCHNVRVAVGAITRIPHRLKSVEKLMDNEVLSAELLDQAAEEVVQKVEPMLDMRASAEHRRSMLSAVFKRAMHTLAQAG
jgi:CO/xanthine dehydrogenase FAD-binding subunit